MSHTQQNQDRLLGMEIGGKYKIVKLLGEGGMGAVYLGEQKLGATIRKVAIKTLHQHLSHDEKILARFEREVGTVAALQHPNTIQVFDYGKMDDGQLYIVMEFVEGRSVATVLEQDGPMEPLRVQKILEQICGSLEEAHGQGIVHRDLKPDNVVLCERAGQKDWVEVLDFGIAKRSTEEDKQEQKLTQQGMVLGTPPYMSPEQFTGKPIDKRSDIYSLGVMCFEMLTGSLPFSGNTAWEWATAHMTAQPVSMDTLPVGGRVPAAMKSAIQKALEKDPNQRWSTVTEFYQAFAQGVTAHVALGATAPMGPDGPPRPKTEMGAPAPGGMYGGAPGAPVAYASAPQGPYPTPGASPAHYATPPGAVPAQYGTPAQGNQSYSPQPPFQGVAPGPPQRHRSGGGGNGLLFALIGLGALIGVGGLVGYLVTRKAPTVTVGTGTATTATTTATTTTTKTTTTTTADTTAPLASLKGTTTTTVPATGTGTGTKPTGTGTVKPPPSATATVPTATTTTTATAPPTVTTPPPSGPQECAAAVLMRKLGRVTEAETLRIKCVEKGGPDPFPK